MLIVKHCPIFIDKLLFKFFGPGALWQTTGNWPFEVLQNVSHCYEVGKWVFYEKPKAFSDDALILNIKTAVPLSSSTPSKEFWGKLVD